MEHVNDSAILLPASDPARPTSGLYLVDVLTRDATGLFAAYRGAVTGDELKTDRAGAVAAIMRGGLKLTWPEARAAWPEIPESKFRR